MHLFSRIIDIFDRVFQYILIFFMVEITLVISMSVVSRYFMNSPVYWAEEVTRYSFVWATFIGAACAYRQKELVSMSVVLNALSRINRKRVSLVLEIIVAVFLVLAIFYGTSMAVVVKPQLAVSTRVSLAWLYSVVPISCSFMFLCCLENIYTLVRDMVPVNRRAVQ